MVDTLKQFLAKRKRKNELFNKEVEEQFFKKKLNFG